MLANLSLLFSYPFKAWRGKRPDSQGHDWLRGGVPYPDGAFHVLTDQGVLHDEGEAQGLDTQVRAWRLAGGRGRGAYHLDRFMCLVGIQWPGESIYGPAAALETAKPIIDAATDTCDPQGRHLLIKDDDPSHRVMTAYYTAPGTSACGVTLYASMIPLSPEERMPSGVVNRFEAGALKGYTAKVSIPDGTWMTSNHRLDPEERKLRMEKTMALSYDMWKDKPALSGNVGVFSSISFPNLNYLGDVDNAECIAGLLEGAVVLGKLRI